MSKYSPLGAYLRQQRRDVVPMKFAEIEKIIGGKLPASARYRAWWSNNDFNSVLTKVWLEAGFKSEQVDMAKHKLVFRRVRKPQAADAAGPAAGEHAVSSALRCNARSRPHHARHRSHAAGRSGMGGSARRSVRQGEAGAVSAAAPSRHLCRHLADRKSAFDAGGRRGVACERRRHLISRRSPHGRSACWPRAGGCNC